MTRRIPSLVALAVAIVAVVLVARDPVPQATATFSRSVNGWMPAAPAPGGLTETWFCPGVPATGVDDVRGSVLIANRADVRMVGTILLMNERGENARLDLIVDPWSTATVELDRQLPGAMVAAVVEVEGGGAIVEQQSYRPSGDSDAPCANATSDTWYLADGFTVEGSLDEVVLTNPYEQTVVANLEFATQEGARSPASYRGLTVPPRSVRVIELGAPGAGAQSEPVLAVRVETTQGRLVVGRSQRFLGGGRLGTQVTLAAPEPREQWWFANGAKGPGTSERFSIYNPTDTAVDVDVIFLGIATPVVVDPIAVPAREVVTFDAGPLADLAEGRHATVFATSTNEAAIVVERAVTTTVGDVVATSVLLGATPRQDGYVASTWHLPVGPSEPIDDGVVVYNADNAEGLVSVFAVGISGPVPVPDLQDLVLAPAGLLPIDLSDPLVLGRELIIESTTRVFIERSYPTGRGDTRTSAWAVPDG